MTAPFYQAHIPLPNIMKNKVEELLKKAEKVKKNVIKIIPPVGEGAKFDASLEMTFKMF